MLILQRVVVLDLDEYDLKAVRTCRDFDGEKGSHKCPLRAANQTAYTRGAENFGRRRVEGL